MIKYREEHINEMNKKSSYRTISLDIKDQNKQDEIENDFRGFRKTNEIDSIL